MKLDKTVAAVVTGGASGLGAATSRMLASHGVKVAIFDLNAEQGEELAREIGGVFCKVNVTSTEEVEAGFAKARAAHLKAIELAEEARRATPNNVGILASLGSYYAAIGEAKKSVPLLRQAIALDPDSATTAYLVGETYETLHQRDEALRWIGIALRKGYSREQVKRNPELAQLRKDPRFDLTKK